MAVIAKKDIEILTRQVVEQEKDILDTIKREHIEIDSALLNEEFMPKIQKKLGQIIGTELKESINENGISLGDMEIIVRRFDILEKKICEQKSIVPNVARKENHVLKRFGSITDINKTMPRSLSSINLNSTNVYAEPQAPTSRLNSNTNVTLIPTNMDKENISVMNNKLTSNQMIEHNSLMGYIQVRLESLEFNSNDYSTILKEFRQKYMDSFDRLRIFFKEIHPVQSDKSVEIGNDFSLKNLDQELLIMMKKLSEALLQMRFIAENKNLYNLDSIKAVESLLSDELTDILEQFYRCNK